MRLNGRQQIMVYLGLSPRNRDAWRKIRVRYGDAIRCLPGSGRVWARSEDLDSVDIRECKTVAVLLAARSRHGEAVGEAVGGYPRQYQKLVKGMFKSRG